MFFVVKYFFWGGKRCDIFIFIDQDLVFEELGRFQKYVYKGFKIIQDQEKTTPSGILTYIHHTNQPFM